MGNVHTHLLVGAIRETIHIDFDTLLLRMVNGYFRTEMTGSSHSGRESNCRTQPPTPRLRGWGARGEVGLPDLRTWRSPMELGFRSEEGAVPAGAGMSGRHKEAGSGSAGPWDPASELLWRSGPR